MSFVIIIGYDGDNGMSHVTVNGRCRPGEHQLVHDGSASNAWEREAKGRPKNEVFVS